MIEKPRGEMSPEQKETPKQELFEFVEDNSSVVNDAKKTLEQQGLTTGVVNFGKGDRAQFWQQAETVEEFLEHPRAAEVIALNLYPTHDIRHSLSVAVRDGRVLQFLNDMANKRLSDEQSSYDREQWAKEHAEEIVTAFREAMLEQKGE